MLQLTFNPGLTLTSFRTTRPRTLVERLSKARRQRQREGHQTNKRLMIKTIDRFHCYPIKK